MKQYPKVNEDVYKLDPNDSRPAHIGSTLGSAEVLADKFRQLYEEFQPHMFDFIVKEIWLEQHFTYKGVRRHKRAGNGYTNDWVFGFFMNRMVGKGHKFVLNFIFQAVSTYLKDLYPDFMIRDPFLEPEYYKFPYKNVSLDHMAFVYMMHNRLEMLDYAEEKNMKFGDFANWAYNWACCYNDETGSEYVLASTAHYWKHMRDRSLPKDWANAKFTFDMKK